jgi:hypothetical protein
MSKSVYVQASATKCAWFSEFKYRRISGKFDEDFLCDSLLFQSSSDESSDFSDRDIEILKKSLEKQNTNKNDENICKKESE